jgi:hypothetical protein
MFLSARTRIDQRIVAVEIMVPVELEPHGADDPPEALIDDLHARFLVLFLRNNQLVGENIVIMTFCGSQSFAV